MYSYFVCVMFVCVRNAYVMVYAFECACVCVCVRVCEFRPENNLVKSALYVRLSGLHSKALPIELSH